MTQKSTTSKTAPASAVATSHNDQLSPNKLVPFSTGIPHYVGLELDAAAGVGTRAAMGRKILTDWADARRKGKKG